MPTYEYACSSCKHEWEFEQSIKDAALTECPSCHQQTARRQISRGTGFILKGGGWYSDLYSSTGNKGSSTSSSSSSSSDKPKGGSGSESGGSTPAAPSGGSSPPAGGSSAKSSTAAA